MRRLEMLFIVMLLFVTVDLSQAQVIKNEFKKGKKVEHRALRKLIGTNINVVSKSSFVKSFGKLSDVVWKRTVFFDEATFKEGGHNLTAYFDEFGKLVGTTSVVAFADIPVLAQKKIAKNYKYARIGKVTYFDDNELNNTDMMLFGIQFVDTDKYFVEMMQGAKRFILDCDSKGNVTLFKQL
jgi:hypothetical protein